MISLLKSKSDFFNLRTIFLSADKLSVHHWQKGKLGSSYLFDVDEAGQMNFKRYLEQSSNTPAYVLIDTIEEEFREDTIPHVFGSDRDALIKRKQGKLFRDAEYHYADFLGRDEQGRRDDKFLFTAITNNQLLTPWLELLDEHKVPVKGVISLPQLLQSFIKHIPDVSKHALVVTMQSISGLRQTFFLDKKLKLSRLSKLPRYGTDPYAPRIDSEVDKIQRYLNSLRLVPNDVPLDVYVLADKRTLEDFDREKTKSPMFKHHLIDIKEVSSKLGLEMEKSIPFIDQLLMVHLFNDRPKNYYASEKDMRYAKMRNMKVAMNVCSVLVLLTSVAYSGYSLMGAIFYQQQSTDAKNKADYYQARYNLAKERLPETPVDSYQIKTAVDAIDTIKQYKSSPYEMLSILGSNLVNFPQVQLDSFDWSFSMDPYRDTVASSDSINYEQSAEESNEVPKFYQISNIKARLEPFDGNYREAIATVNQFVETLKSEKEVYDVSIESLPLDISSESTLQGDADKQEKTALFSLRAVVGVYE